jgi:hypothetical protein
VALCWDVPPEVLPDGTQVRRFTSNGHGPVHVRPDGNLTHTLHAGSPGRRARWDQLSDSGAPDLLGHTIGAGSRGRG